MVSFKRTWSRLGDARDAGAARNTAAVLLCGEMLACVLILNKVPCKSSCLLTQKHISSQASSSIAACRYRDRLGRVHAASADIPPGRLWKTCTERVCFARLTSILLLHLTISQHAEGVLGAHNNNNMLLL